MSQISTQSGRAIAAPSSTTRPMADLIGKFTNRLEDKPGDFRRKLISASLAPVGAEKLALEARRDELRASLTPSPGVAADDAIYAILAGSNTFGMSGREADAKVRLYAEALEKQPTWAINEARKRFGKGVQQVAAAVAAADATALKESLRSTGSATVVVGDETVTLAPDEVIITETPRSGWAVAAEAGATLALDLELTPQLRRAGLARDAIRQIQEARKTSGLAVSDRIVLRFEADQEETAAALAEHAELVADEVLATDYAAGQAGWDNPAAFREEGIGLTFWLRKA